MKKIWDWYYGKASIRKKLIISYLILVILPILVLGMYSYYVSKKNLIRQTKHTMESNVDAISYSLQNDIQRETDNIKYLSYNAKLRGKWIEKQKCVSKRNERFCRAHILVFYSQ